MRERENTRLETNTADRCYGKTEALPPSPSLTLPLSSSLSLWLACSLAPPSSSLSPVFRFCTGSALSLSLPLSLAPWTSNSQAMHQEGGQTDGRTDRRASCVQAELTDTFFFCLTQRQMCFHLLPLFETSGPPSLSVFFSFFKAQQLAPLHLPSF